MIKCFSFSILLFITFFGFAHAASQDFTAKLSVVADDVTPPTTPSSLTAIPVASTQINLSWGASTDNYIFGGYQVFRDATQIATTTLTSYSDSGLIASTTYTYFVRAFDSVGLLSSSSNSVATTTLQVTPTSTPTTTPEQRGGVSDVVRLISFDTVPYFHSEQLTWETNIYAQFEIRWGRTTSYELGFVTSNLFTHNNTTSIGDLQPGTVYAYQLVAHNRSGRTFILKEGQFKTLDAPDTEAPANVSNLRASTDGDTVHLSWDDPSDADFSYVRIVRNYLFYPTDSTDGYLVYQANGNFFVDKNALQKRAIQYYSVFSYDTKGNVSSGAIIAVTLRNNSQNATTSTTTVQSALNITLADIEIVQSDIVVDPATVDATKPILFRIAYEKLPEHLKTITITLTDPHDATLSFSFLLKINNDKTYYEAMVAPLKREGQYPILLSLFDYQTQKLWSVTGALIAHVSATDTTSFIFPLFTRDISIPPAIGLFLWLLFLLLLLFLLYIALKQIRIKHAAYEGLSQKIIAWSVAVCFVIGGMSAYIAHFVWQIGGTHAFEQQNTATSFVALQSGFDSTSLLIGISAFLFLLVCLLFLFRFLHKK